MIRNQVLLFSFSFFLGRCLEKIFEELFGVEGVHTVFYTDETTACSTETANKWNETFVNDPSAKGL